MKHTTRTDDAAPAASPLGALADQAEDLLTPPTDTGTADGTGDGDTAPAPRMTNVQVLMMAVELVRDTLCSFAKVSSPKETMSNEVMLPVIEANAAVLDKYGIDLNSAAGDYMTEIKAALVTVPVLLAIRAGLADEVRASKATTSSAPAVTGATVLHAVPVDGQQ